MRHQIVAVRTDGGSELHQIAGCAYVYKDDSYRGAALPTEAVASHVVDKSHTYFTHDWRGDAAEVRGVRRSDGSYYLRTTADATKADNLLGLPRYGN